MAGWTSSTSSAGYDASEQVKAAVAQRYRENGLSSFNNNTYDVVGLNTQQIPMMKEAIRAYIEEIKAHLRKIDISVDPSIGVKGANVEQAVRDYIGRVVFYCNQVLSYLAAFNDKLQKVQEAWEAYDKSTADTIRGTIDSNFTNGGNLSYQEGVAGFAINGKF